MLVRWSPFTNRNQSASELSPNPFASDFDNLFRDFTSWGAGPRLDSILTPPADVSETENEVQVKIDLPGHAAKDIEVKLEGDTLTIQSERKSEKQEKGENCLRTERSYGLFSRSFVLPPVVDGSKPEARYVNGVLTVTLPKKEAARARVIEVKD